MSTGVLVGLAVVASGALMVALSAGAIASHPPSCTRNPLALNVAVAPELAPAVRAVAQDFNARQQPARGRCIRIGVTAQDPAGAAALIDGQAAAHGAAVPAAWIPDSSLWVDVARSFPLGARAVQPAGIDVASSPLVLVTPRAVEQSTRIFAAPTGWGVLLPPSAGGPPASLRLRAALPDPAASAAGLAALLELSKLLGHTAAAQSELASFEHGVQATGPFASPASLAALVASAGPPLDSRPVTVTTEQAVLAYDRAHPSAPLAADYPVSFKAGLGSPVLNYPYVVTTTSPLLARAARRFGLALQQPQAVTAIRYAGFRSADGTGAAMPGYTGLRGQVLQQAATPAAGAVQATEQDWARLRPAPAALIVADTSPAMSAAAAGGGDLEQQAITAAGLTAALLPGSAQAGEWQVPGPATDGTATDGTTTSGTATSGTATPAAGGTAGAYRELVSLGPLDSPASARPGALARGELLGQVTAALRAGGSQASVALNDTVLAAARKVAAASRPGAPAAVIVITAGSDGGKDAPASTLETGLQALASHHVQVIAIVLGHGADLATWQQAAADTGGVVYQVTAPAQLGTAIRGILARLR